MSRPIVWFRVPRGRVWHVRFGTVDEWSVLALCGAADYSGESQEAAPPTGGKPCPSCLAAASTITEAGIEARAKWAARHPVDPWADEVGDAEILVHCGTFDCDHACQAENDHLCGSTCPCAEAEVE